MHTWKYHSPSPFLFPISSRLSYDEPRHVFFRGGSASSPYHFQTFILMASSPPTQTSRSHGDTFRNPFYPLFYFAFSHPTRTPHLLHDPFTFLFFQKKFPAFCSAQPRPPASDGRGRVQTGCLIGAAPQSRLRFH